MRGRLPAYRLAQAVCSAWREGLSLSDLPDLLGVSRPTFYRFYKNLVKDGFRIRLVPNTLALGYVAYLVGTPTGERGARGRVRGVRMLYITSTLAPSLEGILETLNINFLGPFIVESVLCPTGEQFKVFLRRRMPVGKSEFAIIKEASEEFQGVKALAAKVGLSWQYVANILRRIRLQNLIVGPLVSWTPVPGCYLGTILILRSRPPYQLLRELRGSFGSVILRHKRDPSHVILAMLSPGQLVDIIDGYSGDVISWFYIKKGHPFTPFKEPFLLDAHEMREYMEEYDGISLLSLFTKSLGL